MGKCDAVYYLCVFAAGRFKGVLCLSTVTECGN